MPLKQQHRRPQLCLERQEQSEETGESRRLIQELVDTEAKTENEKALNVSTQPEFINRLPSEGGRAWH